MRKLQRKMIEKWNAKSNKKMKKRKLKSADKRTNFKDSKKMLWGVAS